MKSVNGFIIHGNVDPVTSLERSTKVDIAMNRAWIDEKEVKKKVADWARVTILDEKQVARVAENAKAGDVALVKGRIGNNSYQKNSVMVYRMDFIASTFNVSPKA